MWAYCRRRVDRLSFSLPRMRLGCVGFHLCGNHWLQNDCRVSVVMADLEMRSLSAAVIGHGLLIV